MVATPCLIPEPPTEPVRKFSACGRHKIQSEWNVTTEDELKQIDKDARAAVDKEVAEAEAMPPPDATPQIVFEDIYVRGSEPQFMRGRTLDENYYY
jgi:pyruvate dehydrogenase E1 component alpha subunit